MFNKSSFHILTLLIIIVLIETRFALRTRKCNSDEPCTPLSNCPEILKLARSQEFEAQRKFRKTFCRFDRIVYVCCPMVPSIHFPVTIDTPTEEPGSPPSNLLPNECGKPSTADRIHGGRPAPIGAYPWIVAFGYSEDGVPGLRFDCAGSLINSRYVLTAAHCLHQDKIGSRKLSVLHLGDWDLSTDIDCQAKREGKKCYKAHIVAKPESILLHPSYSKRASDSDDIALVRMDRTIDFKSKDNAPVEPVCLPSENQDPEVLTEGRAAVVAGWGFTEHGNRSDILLRVKLPFARDTLCKGAFGQKFVSNQLCLGGIEGEDTCSGDSGGPLLTSGPQGPPYIQIGIVSYGSFPCALSKNPAVYTSVSPYVAWIKENIRP